VQENEGIEKQARRKRRSREQIAELVREFKSSGLSQRRFSLTAELRLASIVGSH
jgi:hypothetical protein